MFTFQPPSTLYFPFQNTKSSPFIYRKRFNRPSSRRARHYVHQRSKSSSEFEVDFNPREALTKSVLQPHHSHNSRSFSPPSVVDKLHDNIRKISKKDKRKILQVALSSRKRQIDRKKREEAIPPDPIVFEPMVYRTKKSQRRAISFRGLLFKSEGAAYFLRPKKYFVFVPHSGGLYRVDLSLHDAGTVSNIIEKALIKYEVLVGKPAPFGVNPRAYRLFISENDGSIDDDFPSLGYNKLIHTYRCKFFVLDKNKQFLRDQKDENENENTSVKEIQDLDDIRLKVFQNQNFERYHYVVVPPDLLVRDLLKIICQKIGISDFSSYHLQMFREKKKIEIPLELRYRTVCLANIHRIMLTKKYNLLDDEEAVGEEDNGEDEEKISNNLSNNEQNSNEPNSDAVKTKNTKKYLNREKKDEQKEIEEELAEYPLLSKRAIDEFQYREYKVIKYTMFYLKHYLILGFDGKTMCCKYSKFKKKSFFSYAQYNSSSEQDSPLRGMEKHIERSFNNLKKIRTFSNHPKKFEIVFLDDETFGFDARTKVEAEEIIQRLNLLLKYYKQERMLEGLLERRGNSNYLTSMDFSSITRSFENTFE